MIYNVNTFDGLVNTITITANRNDTSFINQIPTFISLTEQTIFIRLSTLGNENYVTSNFTPGNGVIPKPGDWGRTNKISYINDKGNLNILFRLSVPTLETFNPDTINPSKLPERYYSDYGYYYSMISPTPSQALNFNMAYFGKIPPLSPTNQKNWNSVYGYDMLFNGCMQRAYEFLNDDTWAAYYGDKFDKSISDYEKYDKQRLSDTSVAVENE